MEIISDLIDFYLSNSTEYALLITGEWGVGKTHYFNNVIKAQVEKTPTLENNNVCYKPIFVSLFGLKSIEDVQSAIFLTLFPLLENKSIKIGYGIGKVLLKGLFAIKGLPALIGSIDESEKALKKAAYTSLQISNLVFCFDDLERISSSLNIEEVIGFINTLLDNSGVKVIIIANVDKIDAEKFATLKEKIIGNTIEFTLNLNRSLDNIIKEHFSSYGIYEAFLLDNRDIVLNVFQDNSKNLRSLIFGLTHFHNIHSIFKKNIAELPLALKDSQDEILKNLFHFTLAIAIEFRLGHITYKNRNRLNETNYRLINSILSNNEKEKTYADHFHKKYYVETSYFFYTSIYEFVTGGKAINHSVLMDELKSQYGIKEEFISDAYNIMNQLSFLACFKLTDKQYRELTYDLKNYALKGEYLLSDYNTVFAMLTRFDNPLKYDVERLKEELITAIKKNRKKFQYIPNLDFRLTLSSNQEFIDQHLQIKSIVETVNNDLEQERNTLVSLDMEKLFYQNIETFRNKSINEKEYLYDALFQHFDHRKFYSFFKRSDNNTKKIISDILRARFRNGIIEELKKELPFIELLHQKVTTEISKRNNFNLSGYIWKEFEKVLSNAIQKVKSSES